LRFEGTRSTGGAQFEKKTPHLTQDLKGLVVPMRSLVLLSILIGVLTLNSDAEDAAGSAWSQLQALDAQVHEKVPIGTNAVEFYAVREKALHESAADFARRFPRDAHAPQATLWKIQTTDFPDPADQRIALLRQNETEARSLVEDPALPATFRFEVESTILTQWLDRPDLIGPDQAANLEDRIAKLIQSNAAEPALVSFQLARADLMLRFDHEKGMAFLRELTRAPEQNLANAAKARMVKEQIIGQPVSFQFTAADGSSVDTSELRGKVVLVDFWASWCPDCLREMPAVRRTYQKYKDKGFAVIGISLDKDAQALANLVARKLIPWPQYFDGKGWENDFATKYGVHSIPEMWLINQRGKVASTDVTVEQLEQRIEQLLSSGDDLSRN
jgi:thiol-disulfide isomerase/thioredoxin